jgi:hypothetical protein
VVSRFKTVGGGEPIVDSTTVYLDSVYRQLHVDDPILFTVGGGSPHFATVAAVDEQPVVVKEAVKDNDVILVPETTMPVTKVTLSGDPLPLDPDSKIKLAFHFSFVDGGRITTVPETELTREQLTAAPLPVTGLVERPPEVAPSGSLDQKFLLTDPDANGAEVDGRMLFGASGRAQFDILANLAAVPSPLPADLYKTPLTVYGNVITATRGESVFNEVLGSGDPRIPGQQFTLKKKPLTYVSAPNALGRSSTLQLSCCPPSQVLGRERPARLRSLPNPCSAASGLRADGRDAPRVRERRPAVGALRLRVGASAAHLAHGPAPGERLVTRSIAKTDGGAECFADCIILQPAEPCFIGTTCGCALLADTRAVLGTSVESVVLDYAIREERLAGTLRATSIFGYSWAPAIVELRILVFADMPTFAAIQWIGLRVPAARAVATNAAARCVARTTRCRSISRGSAGRARAAIRRSPPLPSSCGAALGAGAGKRATRASRATPARVSSHAGSSGASERPTRESAGRASALAGASARALARARASCRPATRPTRVRNADVGKTRQSRITAVCFALAAFSSGRAAIVIPSAPVFGASADRQESNQTTECRVTSSSPRWSHGYKRFHGENRSARTEPARGASPLSGPYPVEVFS